MLEGKMFKTQVVRKNRQQTGVLSDTDALRMGLRDLGVGRDLIPESAPDPEEAIRRNRRKFLATMRRRSGRLSTILTGGEPDGGYGL